MKIRQTVALTLAVAFATGMSTQPVLRAGAAQDPGSITGTAKNEAKKPFPDYSVRAREVKQGVIAATVQLDPQGNFTLAGVDPANYLVELLNSKGKVVCTEGPFDLTKQPIRKDVKIDCGNPAAWWLLAAAGLAGITAGVAGGEKASASK